MKFLIRQFITPNFKIYCGSSSKAMVDREKKRRRWKYKKLNISRMKRAFPMK